MTVRDRWGVLTDVRLSKIASYCGVSLAWLREFCESLGITMQKRERINLGDVVYLLVELEVARPPTSEESPSIVPGAETETTNLGTRADSSLGLRLDGLELTDQDFSSAALSGASFRGCELTRANFAGANLAGADFTGAILRYAVFTRADLSEAIFTRADVRFAKFFGTALAAGQLTGALTDGAEFESSGRP